MPPYTTKAKRIAGTRYREVYDEAFDYYKELRRWTRRRPYVRSAYFNRSKIFLDAFWQHLHQKNWRDRARRVRFFPAAIELLKYTRQDPISMQNPNKKNQMFHKFFGTTSDGHGFAIQIIEDKRNGNKNLISIFPTKQ